MNGNPFLTGWLIECPHLIWRSHSPFWTVSAGCHIHRQAGRGTAGASRFSVSSLPDPCVFSDSWVIVLQLKTDVMVSYVLNLFLWGYFGKLWVLHKRALEFWSFLMNSFWWTRLSSRAREQECLDRVERPWVFCRGPQTNTINPGCQHSERPSLSSSHKTNARRPSCRAIYASLTESLEVVTREACWRRNVGARRAWGME